MEISPRRYSPRRYNHPLKVGNRGTSLLGPHSSCSCICLCAHQACVITIKAKKNLAEYPESACVKDLVNVARNHHHSSRVAHLTAKLYPASVRVVYISDLVVTAIRREFSCCIPHSQATTASACVVYISVLARSHPKGVFVLHTSPPS